MASHLHELVATIKAELDVRVLATYPAGVPCLIDDDGDRQTSHNLTPPATRWRYLRSTGTAPKGASHNPKHLYLRLVQVEVRIWGADLEKTERLLEHVAASVWTVSSGVIRFLGETWTPHGTLAKGHEVTVVFGPVPMPLSDTTKDVGQAANAGHTAHFDENGDETCGHELPPTP